MYIDPTRIRRLALVLFALIASALFSGRVTQAADQIHLVQTTELAQPPNRNTVIISLPDGGRCAGFLVRSNKVATAAHCIVDSATGRPLPNLTSTTVRPGYSDGSAPYRGCGVKRTWAHPHFVRTSGDTKAGVHWSNRNYDYAVLTLECSYAGYMVMGLTTSTFVGGQLPGGTRVGLNGFPLDPNVTGADGNHMVRTTGSVRALASYPFHVYFTNYSARGMSGGPLWVYDRTGSCGSTFCAVAINSECASAVGDDTVCGAGMRRGIRITPRVAADLLGH